MHCRPTMGRQVDWRITEDSLKKTTRTAGEDPSIFATALETLAIKAFGDMGQMARLRLIRDRFIADHSSCELRRYLDSVPPETSIRDVVMLQTLPICPGWGGGLSRSPHGFRWCWSRRP